VIELLPASHSVSFEVGKLHDVARIPHPPSPHTVIVILLLSSMTPYAPYAVAIVVAVASPKIVCANRKAPICRLSGIVPRQNPLSSQMRAHRIQEN
jgi:hypothetical protein